MREVQHARTLRVAQLSVLAKPQQKAAANFSLATHWCGSRQKKLRVSRFPSPAAAAGEERSCRPTSTKRTAGCNSLSRCTRRFPGAWIIICVSASVWPPRVRKHMNQNWHAPITPHLLGGISLVAICVSELPLSMWSRQGERARTRLFLSHSYNGLCSRCPPTVALWAPCAKQLNGIAHSHYTFMVMAIWPLFLSICTESSIKMWFKRSNLFYGVINMCTVHYNHFERCCKFASTILGHLYDYYF